MRDCSCQACRCVDIYPLCSLPKYSNTYSVDTSINEFSQEERTQSIESVHVLKGELARREEDFQYTQQLQDLTAQEQSAAARVSYERLLADKKAADIRLDETEASWATIQSKSM